MTFSATPYPQGLYDSANEHDACGVAFLVDARGRRVVQARQQAERSGRNVDEAIMEAARG